MEETNITIPKKEITPGVFTTGGVATVPTNSPAAITPANLQPQNKIDLTGTEIKNTDTGADVVTGAMQGATQFDTDYQRMLDLQNQPPQNQSALDDALSKLIGAEANLGGQGSDQLSVEAQLGLPALSKERASNQGLIKTGIAEYNAMKAEFDQLNADLEAGAGRKGLTTSALLGQQGAIERAKLARLNSKAAEIGILQAKDLSLAGDIEAAQRTADRAIDLKYKDREAEYTTKLNQYNRIKDFLNEDEKKRGKALEYALNKEATTLKEVKDFQKTILNNAISSNAPQRVINAIVNGTSIEEITKAGAGYLQSAMDKIDLQIKDAQLRKLNNEIKSITTASPVEAKVNATMTLKGLISDLATGTGKKGAVGAGFQKFIPGFLKPGDGQFLPGTKAAGYETTFNQLKDTLAFENISKLKGAMSDKDIQFLRNIGTKLSLGMSEKEFNTELQKLDQTMNEVLVKNGVDPTTINSYSALDNDTLLALPQQEKSNSQFFK